MKDRFQSERFRSAAAAVFPVNWPDRNLLSREATAWSAWIASAHSHDFDVALFARRSLFGKPPVSTPDSSLSGTTGVVLLNQFAVRRSGVHRHSDSEVINMNP